MVNEHYLAGGNIDSESDINALHAEEESEKIQEDMIARFYNKFY